MEEHKKEALCERCGKYEADFVVMDNLEGRAVLVCYACMQRGGSRRLR